MAPGKEKTELTNEEKLMFEKVSNNDITGLQLLLTQGQKADIFDEDGMTPLLHAAFKGNKEMVQLLLDHGADVNSSRHEHSYTALHFAALSGNPEVCQLLLLAGAKPLAQNSVSRTAAQMAAFVGNHACVATINNFIPKSDVEYYTTQQFLQKEPILKPFLVDPLHKFIMQININPIRVAINLQRSGILHEHMKDVKNVLELMCSREMKRGPDTNEVMAFKYHYLAYVVGEIIKCRERQLSAKKDDTSTTEEKKSMDVVELFARKLLKTNKDGVCEYMDSFLKEGVREFPFRECTIFRQMVTTLAGPDPPSALSVITAAINGQRGFLNNVPVCNTCGEEKPAKKCSKCKAVQYCDRECQRLHWFLHKKACARLSSEPPSNSATKEKPQIDAATLSSQIQNLLVNK